MTPFLTVKFLKVIFAPAPTDLVKVNALFKIIPENSPVKYPRTELSDFLK